jgi:8-oxo-dGTP pyrophosphatase MutT (NUDIX family)
MKASPPQATPWQVLERQPLLDRLPWIAVWLERVRLPNGIVIDDYFRLILRDWVAVFAVTEDGRVPLVRQYRHGVGVAMLELPAGYVDGDESPLAAAARELREEAGCTAESFTLLDSFAILPERSTMTMHLVLARGARVVGDLQLEATEALTVEWLALADLAAAWRQGAIAAAAHAAAIARGLAAVGML